MKNQLEKRFSKNIAEDITRELMMYDSYYKAMNGIDFTPIPFFSLENLYNYELSNK